MSPMRKYDTKEHRTARKHLGREVASGVALCWRCGRPIAPGSKWHVGHDDAGERIMGAEHASCNLSAQNRVRAARARAFVNGGRAVVPVESGPRWSRHWFGGFDERCPDCRALSAPCPAAAGAAP
jgi:hypothetical protein